MSSENGAKGPAGGENDMGLCVNSHTNVAGEVQTPNSDQDNKSETFGNKAIDWKACKRLYGLFRMSSGSFEALSILWLYLQFMGKMETGCNFSEVANWSGFGTRWKWRFNYRLQQLIALHAVEKIPFNGGYRYLILPKGFAILRAWEQARKDIIEDIQRRSIIAKLKKETTRLKRISYNKRNLDSKGRFLPGKPLQG